MQIFFDMRLRNGRLALAEFNHHAEISDLTFGLKNRIHLAANGVSLINKLLRLLAIIPKRFPCHQRFKLALSFLQVGDVKETSASA